MAGPAGRRDARQPRLTRNLQPLGPPLVRGQGAWVWTQGGKRILDFCSQTLNMNLGHCHPQVVAAVRRQAGRLNYASSRFLHPPGIELAEALGRILPTGLDRLNIKMVSGSEANEGALKAARRVHRKPTVAALYGGFLGVTVETMKASGKYFGLDYLGDGGGYVHAAPPAPGECPYHPAREACTHDCAQWLERLLERRQDIAAVLLEPILVDTGGVLVPPRGYLDRIRRTCTRHGVALAFDEDQTAFGWLGTWFAADHFGVVPDLMTFGKGLASGMPLSVLAMRRKYDVLDYGEHEFTTGANPLCCAAALATLGVLGRPGFLRRVQGLGAHLQARLAESLSSIPRIQIRSAGLMAGIDVRKRDGTPDPRAARQVFDACLRAGLLVRISQEYHGNVLILKPPLVVTRAEIDAAVQTLARCARRVLA